MPRKTPRSIQVEYYNADRIPNPKRRGHTPYQTFAGVRAAIVAACRDFGTVGPDDTYECDFWVCDDQYNDERYQYMEIYNRAALSPAWLQEVMAALRKCPGWGIGLRNLRFSYLLIFGEKLMVNGHPFAGCNTVESVATAASAILWGVNGEEDPLHDERFHRAELRAASTCGCYHCCTLFAPRKIRTWTDKNARGIGQTALCPNCGQPRVVAAKPGYELEMTQLRQLRALAFGPSSD